MRCPRCQAPVDDRAPACPRCAAPLALRDEPAGKPLDRDLTLDRRSGRRLAATPLRPIPAGGDRPPRVTPRFWKLEEPNGRPRPAAAAPAAEAEIPPEPMEIGEGDILDEQLAAEEAAAEAELTQAEQQLARLEAWSEGPTRLDARQRTPVEAEAAALAADAAPTRPTPPVAPPQDQPRRARQGSLPFPAPLRPLPAPPLRRLTGWAVDGALAGALGWLLVAGGARLAGAAGPDLALLPSAGALAALLHFTHATLGHALAGRTLGKWMAGTVLVGPDGRPPTPGRAALRSLLSLAAAAPMALGLLPALFGQGHRGLHDRLAGTAVRVAP